MNISSSGPLSNQLNWAVRDAFLDGIVVVVAAGNNGKDACAYSPGATPEAITVGATEADDTLLHNSNFGPCVDVFAPGAWISSAAHTGPSDYRSFKGTSFAAPHVTGIAALILEANPTYTPQQVTDRIVADATSNTIRSLEASSPNLLAYAVPSIEVESTETTTTLPSTPVPPTVPTRATSDASTSSGSGHSGPATTTTTSTTAPASIIAAPLATPTPPPKFLTKRCKPEARRVVGTVIYRCTAKAKWIRVAANRMSRATSR
jgi:subtilisin family serine protease